MSFAAALILAATVAGQAQQPGASSSGAARATATATATATILRSARISLRDGAGNATASIDGDAPVYRNHRRAGDRVLIEFQ
ncbi:MAG TPA: hypothetical protein VLA37_01335 [Sphingomonadaceae bacterium]|nr:hypothetical protein [Sphingomonadaceae bacterium]